MTIPSFNTIAQVLTLVIGVMAALTTAFWFSLVIWAFRDMRLRSRDPFAQILAALLVAALPFIGIFIYLILRPPETLAERYERALEEEALLQEIEERPRCPECARTVLDGWVLCPSCRAELKKQCVHCAELLELQWGVCPYCTTIQPAKHPPFNRAASPHRIAPPVVQAALPATAAGSGNGAPADQPTRAVAIEPPAPPVLKPQPAGNDHPTIVNLPTRGQAAPENTQPLRPVDRARRIDAARTDD